VRRIAGHLLAIRAPTEERQGAPLLEPCGKPFEAGFRRSDFGWAGGRAVQRSILYLGEVSDGQREAWCRQIEAFYEASGRHRRPTLFPAERTVPDNHADGFGVRSDAMELHRPRQWGACWLACHLYEQLELDRFFAPLLPGSREGTS
jgi:hypothetical protein